ncbi:MAG TPA: DegT/DnrJ/EryC1/StrS family aminotransferase [Nitrososphaeraceae archaeon]|nr:DegT/DnrJ/EryC1/StrS family aminotransferase [Nitrososphaeraceae archaeon]
MSTKQSSIDKPMILINKPWIGEGEKREVVSVLDDNSLTSAAKNGGKRVRELESLLQDYLNVKNVVSINSGTSALLAALLASDIRTGDEVLLPSFTFVATANSILAAGAKPVFVDVNKDDYTIDVSDLKAKITKKTRVIVPVHLYGHPSDMDEIAEVAETRSISIIEDACQSLGSTYNNRQTGTFGIMGCFSFYASKVLTSGEGGAVVTDDDSIAEKLKMIRNHGMVEGYDTRILGLNLRLPEISAAIAKTQMVKLKEMLGLRRRNAEMLTTLISDVANENGITLPSESQSKRFNWYLYTIALTKDNLRDKIQKKMTQNDKVGATVYYDPPVHRTPYYERIMASGTGSQRSSVMGLPNTDWASKHVLSLPIHPMVTPEELERVANSLKSTI